MANTHFKVLILGGGSGGISVAARIANEIHPSEIAIVEPSDKHYYQPLWSLAAAGVVEKEESQKDQVDVMPEGVHWLKHKVLSLDPKNNKVHIESLGDITYDYLIVATGLKLNWDKIKGLEGNLGKNGICSIYQYDQVENTANEIQNFKKGNAVFVMPPTPIKCAGAPQKIMYLAENIFRNNGVRENINIHFATAGKAMFGIPVFAEALAKIVVEKNIQPHFGHKILAVDAEKKEAVFEVVGADGTAKEQRIAYDLLHIVPTMSPHSFISDSDLACKEGEQKSWLEVDKFSLQHLRYPNVFGIGDVTGVPNSKTGAAIRKQAPVVAANLLSLIQGQSLEAKYDGYSSCPLIIDIGHVMLAEFGYDGKLMPSFPLDPAVPRRSMWHLKKDLLPLMYWHGMLKGLM